MMIVVVKNGKHQSIPAGALKRFEAAGWTPLEEFKKLKGKNAELPEKPEEEVEVEPIDTPQGDLPQTGVAPAPVFFGIGATNAD